MEARGIVQVLTSNSVLKLLTSLTCPSMEMNEAKCLDLKRNMKTGETVLQQSSNLKFDYVIDGEFEKIKGVKLEHSNCCPVLNSLLTTKETNMNLCCCVLLKNGRQFLATKRSQSLTFPGAWVLPGGRVEKDQSIIEAGLRECEEEVGRPHTPYNPKHMESLQPMFWQSHYVKDNVIKRSNIVLFITIPTEKFQPKLQLEEVQAYQWMDIVEASKSEGYSSTNKDGFAQGHLRYLKLVAQSIKSESI